MLAYLNNAASTYPKSQNAIRAFVECLEQVPDGARHGSHESSLETCRQTVIDILGNPTKKAIFTSGLTCGINQVIQGYLRQGDSCVVDNRSHNSVLRVLHSTPGIEYRIAPVYSIDETADTNSIIAAFRNDTRLVCLTHVSNVTGTIYPVGKMIETIRSVRDDIAIMVDAGQSAGLVSLHDALMADFVLFPAHKYLHSVPGAAVILAGKDLKPVLYGGTGSESNQLDYRRLANGIHEVGTPNTAAIMSLCKGLAESYSIIEETQEHLRDIFGELWYGVSRIDRFNLMGLPPSESRIGILSVVVPHGDPENEWVPLLKAAGVMVRGGIHCSPSIHQQFGLEKGGSLRFSVSRFTRQEEITYTLGVLENVMKALAG